MWQLTWPHGCFHVWMCAFEHVSLFAWKCAEVEHTMFLYSPGHGDKMQLWRLAWGVLQFKRRLNFSFDVKSTKCLCEWGCAEFVCACTVDYTVKMVSLQSSEWWNDGRIWHLHPPSSLHVWLLFNFTAPFPQISGSKMRVCLINLQTAYSATIANSSLSMSLPFKAL